MEVGRVYLRILYNAHPVVCIILKPEGRSQIGFTWGEFEEV
jgi:hypothetical protein